MAPELSVVVPSHNRPLRLRWLLNALERQTLDRSLWEVIVCHDSGAETEHMLSAHPLRSDGTLRVASRPPGTALAGAKRNIGAGLARAPTVVFTDDDCRPPAEWLERVLGAVREHPGAIIQGPVKGDPDEQVMCRSPFPRTQNFLDVPRAFAETCNIAYPRELIERLGGFDERVLSGEDTDLCVRGRAAGADFVGGERMLTYHAVDEGFLLDWVRDARRWGDLPWLLGRHPELRSAYSLRFFWRSSHAFMLMALVAAVLAPRKPAWALLAARWALEHRLTAGNHGRLRKLALLPGWAVIDAAEIVALARGSVRHRTIFL